MNLNRNIQIYQICSEGKSKSELTLRRLFSVMDLIMQKNIEELVDQPDTTLEKFLSESDLIQEVKYGNKKVINLYRLLNL